MIENIEKLGETAFKQIQQKSELTIFNSSKNDSEEVKSGLLNFLKDLTVAVFLAVEDAHV